MLSTINIGDKMIAKGIQNEIVSFDSDSLILVDEKDYITGYLDKASCHKGQGILHRAFSLFIFNSKGELLLQKRSAGKRLWPQYWSNSCCSHPREKESMEIAIHRRLQQELGMKSSLEYLYKFQYQAQFDSSGAENELCSVFIGHSDDPVLANPYEISDCRFIKPDQLSSEIAKDRDKFTPWLKLEWNHILEHYDKVLQRYQNAKTT